MIFVPILDRSEIELPAIRFLRRIPSLTLFTTKMVFLFAHAHRGEKPLWLRHRVVLAQRIQSGTQAEEDYC